jgi:CRP-like cAMP-binding protein
VRLPEALAQIHARHFAALQPPEFLRLWRMAERRPLPAGTVLTRQGQQAPALYFLLQGAVRVRQGGREVAHLGPGEFVAEMSLLTGALASADAESVGEAEAMCWPVDRLRQLRQRNAGLWTKIQSVLGHDLVAKIQRAAAAGPVLAMPAEAL